jgi:hypothetical protein
MKEANYDLAWIYECIFALKGRWPGRGIYLENSWGNGDLFVQGDHRISGYFQCAIPVHTQWAELTLLNLGIREN